MILALAVGVPLLAGLAVFTLPPRFAAPLGLCGAAATAAVAAVAVASVAADGPRELALGGWQPPLGIALRADGLSAVMLAMTVAVGVGVSVHAARSVPAREGRRSPARSFWTLWLTLWAALNAVFLAGDAFNAYVALELVTLPAVALVALEGGRAAAAGAMRYLIAALVASLAYLLGVALIYGQTATLDLASIAQRIEPGLTVAVAIAALTAGLMLKAALFPLHFWLPRAHANAPAPVSALLSALVVTAAAYLVLRLWLFVLAPAITVAAAEVLGALGAAAIVWGSVQALRARRLKLLVAYSTVAQIGYLFVLVALVWRATDPGTAGAIAAGTTVWQGGVYHAVSHALAKAALFLAAGNVIRSLGEDRIGALAGLSASLPLTVSAIGIAGMSLAGFPPSGGFTAKWLLISGAIEQGAWWWVAVISLGGLLAAAYVLRVMVPAFRRDDGGVPAGPVPRTMELAALGLAVAALALGLRGVELISLLEVGT